MSNFEDRFRSVVEDLTNNQDQLGLTPWEQDFVTDMQERKSLNGISQKQVDKLIDLEDKYL